MDVLFLLIPLSVLLVLVIGVIFWMALRGGQFDDLEGPGLKVLMDDDTPASATAAPSRATHIMPPP